MIFVGAKLNCVRMQEDQQQADELIEQLQNQRNNLKKSLEQQQQNQNNELKRIKRDAENDPQLVQSCNEFKKHFEEYVDIIYDFYCKQKIIKCSMDTLLSTFVHYIELLPSKETTTFPTIQLDKHSTQCIENTLKLYISAHQSRCPLFKNGFYEQFMKTIGNIERANWYNPNDKVDSNLLQRCQRPIRW